MIWRGAGLEPGTADFQAGALPLSRLTSWYLRYPKSVYADKNILNFSVKNYFYRYCYSCLLYLEPGPASDQSRNCMQSGKKNFKLHNTAFWRWPIFRLWPPHCYVLCPLMPRGWSLRIILWSCFVQPCGAAERAGGTEAMAGGELPPPPHSPLRQYRPTVGHQVIQPLPSFLLDAFLLCWLA